MSNFIIIFITMTRGLEFMVNIIFRDEVKLLFGDGSYINIDSIRYSKHTNVFIINTKVLINDIKTEYTDDWKNKLAYLVSQSWKFLGKQGRITIISSIDVK